VQLQLTLVLTGNNIRIHVVLSLLHQRSALSSRSFAGLSVVGIVISVGKEEEEQNRKRFPVLETDRYPKKVMGHATELPGTATGFEKTILSSLCRDLNPCIVSIFTAATFFGDLFAGGLVIGIVVL
jgi:hypothetical protein